MRSTIKVFYVGMTLFEVVHKRKLYLYKNKIECKDVGFITEIIKKQNKKKYICLSCLIYHQYVENLTNYCC